MRTPAKYDICIYKEAVFEETFDFTDDNDVPINMTGCQVYSQLRETKNRHSKLLANFNIDVTQVPQGKIKISLSSSITAALPIRIVGYYDLMVIDNNGKCRYFIDGTAIIYSTVTSLITDPKEYFIDRYSMCSSFLTDNIERIVHVLS